MLAGVAIIPCAPLLVPDLVGTADTADLTAAALDAAARLPASWLVLGAGEHDRVVRPAESGTFAGYGVDLPVRLSPGAATGTPAALPLCALIAGWVRERVRPDATAEVHVFGDPATAGAAGRRLRAGIDAAGHPVGVLVVADGATTLTPAAPGGHHPADAAAQRVLDTALAGGDTGALGALAPAIGGRAAFAALGGLVGPPPGAVTELYRGAPFGVGYFVGVWTP
ncbi:hypothetical protein [Mycobacterium sp. 1274756.6]|uniref:hypothetical protein n=1 Tax=Mycobacterium sp. 1274756.6 TaxID=1834076 RepID=UPI000800122D|nr:hypothetical protein [Mycobacterium sp. 1274756.6]OBJ74242.1 hypothetical protein A5643_01745 [Mycobacterium sp. 1274756.6]